MAENPSWGVLPPFKRAPLPPMPGMLRALGPGVIFMALAQGSGELIFWPYTIAKYGLTFLFLLIPACLLQFPVIYEIGRYTLLTGESIFQGFIRLNRTFAFFLWILMTLSFLWFGAFAAAGGTSIAALTDFPNGWSRREQTLFWAYATMALFLIAILLSKVIYHLVETFMWAVALFTLIGLIWASANAEVLRALPAFVKGLVIPEWPMPRPWDSADATKLLTAITFAGLGGFWTLFYSYWLRDKGAGMAHYCRPTHRTDHRQTGSDSRVRLAAGQRRRASPCKRWHRFMFWDIGIGVIGNMITTLLTCLLAYALLFPKGLTAPRLRDRRGAKPLLRSELGRLGQDIVFNRRGGVSVRHLARYSGRRQPHPYRLCLRLFSAQSAFPIAMVSILFAAAHLDHRRHRADERARYTDPDFRGHRIRRHRDLFSRADFSQSRLPAAPPAQCRQTGEAEFFFHAHLLHRLFCPRDALSPYGAENHLMAMNFAVLSPFSI